MKKLLFMVIGFMFAVSTAFASPSDKLDFTTMSKADSQVLFGGNVQNTMTLKHNELKNTSGKYATSWNRIDAYYYIRSYRQILIKLERNSYFSAREATRERSRLFNIHRQVLREFGIWLPSRSYLSPRITNYRKYSRYFR